MEKREGQGPITRRLKGWRPTPQVSPLEDPLSIKTEKVRLGEELRELRARQFNSGLTPSELARRDQLEKVEAKGGLEETHPEKQERAASQIAADQLARRAR